VFFYTFWPFDHYWRWKNMKKTRFLTKMTFCGQNDKTWSKWSNMLININTKISLCLCFKLLTFLTKMKKHKNTKLQKKVTYHIRTKKWPFFDQKWPKNGFFGPFFMPRPYFIPYTAQSEKRTSFRTPRSQKDRKPEKTCFSCFLLFIMVSVWPIIWHKVEVYDQHFKRLLNSARGPKHKSAKTRAVLGTEKRPKTNLKRGVFLALFRFFRKNRGKRRGVFPCQRQGAFATKVAKVFLFCFAK